MPGESIRLPVAFRRKEHQSGYLKAVTALRQAKHKVSGAGRDENILPAARRERHRIRSQRRAQINIPKRFPRDRVEREEIAFVGSGKYQTARGRQRANPGR